MPSRHSHPVAGRFPAVRLTTLLLLSGLVLTAAAASPLSAQTLSPIRRSIVSPYAEYISEAARRFDIPEAWIYAVMRVESRDNARAISPKGPMGLMQLMPATWAALRARYGLGNDPYDPTDNILAGTAYLREMHDRYGTIPAMLAAYNAGPDRYDDYLATGRPLPPETRTYVDLLAPALGAVAPSPAVPAAPPPPPDWREAPLFVSRSNDSRDVANDASEPPADRGRVSVPAQHGPDDPLRPKAMFVARNATGEVP